MFKAQFLSTCTSPNPLLLLGLMDAQGTCETDVPRGGSYVHLVVAACYLPAARLDIPVGEWVRRGLWVQRYADFLGLARLQLNLRPAHQSPGRLAGPGGQAKVDLCNLGTR